MPRLFFGLEIPVEIKDRLLNVRAAVSGAKWQSAEQLHLTLLFLGHVNEERIAAVCDEAGQIQMDPFGLEVAGTGCFGQLQRPRNLWAGVQPAAPVAELHETLKVRMDNLGFVTESRAFRPHITLARFKRRPWSVGNLLAQHGQSVFGQFPVNQFALFESRQGPVGSVYTVIERFLLPGSDFP